MIVDKFGQHVYTEDNVCDIIMQGIDISKKTFLVEPDNINIEITNTITGRQTLSKYTTEDISVAEFDKKNQENWYMPHSYKDMDIAQYVLSLCSDDSELQRCGHELIMFQERDLFNLLKYMKYLVDVMEQNNIIWGVGRGSSVSSYVLFKMKVHKVDSMFYKLDVSEFLR